MGVIPSKHFGVSAVYFRLRVLTHNLMEVIKALALEGTLRHARAKRLRFLVVFLPGRPVRHARRMVVNVSRWLEGVRLFFEICKRLATLVASSPDG